MDKRCILPHPHEPRSSRPVSTVQIPQQDDKLILKPLFWEETMKIPLVAIAGLAIAFALPTFAQQTNTPDPQLRDASLAFFKEFDDAMLNSDAAAVAALYTEDGCYVDPNAGPIYGKKAIEKLYADLFQKTHFSKHIIKLEQYSPHIIGTAGNEVWMTGEWSLTFQVQNGAPMQWQGHCLDFCVREGDALKWRVNTWNAAGPPTPVAPAQTNASPTSAVDPQVRQQIETLFMKFQEAYNSRDIATIGALHTQNALEVRSWQGLASGRQALENRFKADFATNPGKMVNKLVQLYPIGDAICEIADSDVGGWKAQTVTIYVRDGDTWKASMTYVNNERSVVDPQVLQQVEAPFIKFQEAFNNRDAAAIGALLTQDAIEVRSWPADQNGGLFSGREAQERMFKADFATNPGRMVNKLVAPYPIGSAMCEIADSDVGGHKVQTVTIYIRDGDTWKRCMSYVNPL
jgi:ketosteroid isomerase-like protein